MNIKLDEIIIKFNTIVLFLSILWCLGTTMYQAVKCPKLTQTELFLNIPNSFVLHFIKCK